MSVFLYIVAHQ